MDARAKWSLLILLKIMRLISDTHTNIKSCPEWSVCEISHFADRTAAAAPLLFIPPSFFSASLCAHWAKKNEGILYKFFVSFLNLQTELSDICGKREIKNNVRIDFKQYF